MDELNYTLKSENDLLKTKNETLFRKTRNQQRTISRLRPIPDSWRKTKARTTGTKYREYISKLTPEQREQEESIENIYRERRQEFFQSIGEFRSKYYKKG